MLDRVDGFEWDDGNWPKCGRHGVSREEIESIFLSDPGVFVDPHALERRFRAIGVALSARYVFVAFVVRERDDARLIRPISARYMHAKEIRRYEQG
jgi:uncharacterized DUF497 family protein